jgi:hypothetical protein
MGSEKIKDKRIFIKIFDAKAQRSALSILSTSLDCALFVSFGIRESG